MPMVIFSRARLGLNPSINALATVTIVVVSVVIIASTLYGLRQERKRISSSA
jgi:putrescine transport system permease protein